MEQQSSRTASLLEAKRKYTETPFLRRETTCESILGSAAGVCLVSLFAARGVESWNVLLIAAVIGLLGLISATPLVCAVALTGPIYRRQLDYERGELETWAFGHKVVAAAFSILCLGGAAYLAYSMFFAV